MNAVVPGTMERPRGRGVPGHKLTMSWSGERGDESTSTGECSCGWTESGSSQTVVREEYRWHLDRMWGAAQRKKEHPQTTVPTQQELKRAGAWHMARCRKDEHHSAECQMEFNAYAHGLADNRNHVEEVEPEECPYCGPTATLERSTLE